MKGVQFLHEGLKFQYLTIQGKPRHTGLLPDHRMNYSWVYAKESSKLGRTFKQQFASTYLCQMPIKYQNPTDIKKGRYLLRVCQGYASSHQNLTFDKYFHPELLLCSEVMWNYLLKKEHTS